MAAPSYVDAGTGATDAGGVWSYTCQAPAAAGRVIVVQILQDGSSTGVVAVTGQSNINNLAGSAGWTTVVAEAPVGASSEALQSIFIGRSTGVSAPTISGTNSTSEDLYIRSYQFQDVSTGTTLATVIENSTAGNATNGVGTSNTAADTAVTTLGPDRLALDFVAVNDDNAISAFTGETGGDWTLAVAPYAESSGTDGAIGLQISDLSTLIDNITTPVTGSSIAGSGGSSEQAAQSFPAPAGAAFLSSIAATLRVSGAPADDLIIELQTDAGGVPSGTVVGTIATVAGGSLTTTATRKPYTCSIAISASTQYWITMRRSGARDLTNFFIWSLDDAYAGGDGARMASGTWTALGADHSFEASTKPNTGTIDGGTGSVVDPDAWGVVGFALIGTTVTYEQTHFRYRNDDGNETTATWMADLDTNP